MNGERLVIVFPPKPTPGALTVLVPESRIEEARKLEHERDIARSQDPYFDFAEVLLQIAIVMATVAILSQSRVIFGVALTAAIIGTLLCLNGFFLFFHLPFLSH